MCSSLYKLLLEVSDAIDYVPLFGRFIVDFRELKHELFPDKIQPNRRSTAHFFLLIARSICEQAES
jgi:hypothetical protein